MHPAMRIGIGYVITSFSGPLEVAHIEAGWPFTCVEGQIRKSWSDESWAYHGAFKTMIGEEHVLIPYLPRWRGLVVNAIIWSTPMVMFVLISNLLYDSRIRQGRCGNCGYELRNFDGKKCPECGHVIRDKHVGFQKQNATTPSD